MSETDSNFDDLDPQDVVSEALGEYEDPTDPEVTDPEDPSYVDPAYGATPVEEIAIYEADGSDGNPEDIAAEDIYEADGSDGPTEDEHDYIDGSTRREGPQ